MFHISITLNVYKNGTVEGVSFIHNQAPSDMLCK